MTNSICACVVAGALLIAPGAQAQAVRMVGRAETGTGSAPKAFSPTSDGAWRTSVVGPDGIAREYLYVPATGVTPHVRTSLSLQLNGTPLVTYRYAVTNGPGATQSLARFLLMAVQPVSARDVPDVWRAISSVSGVVFSGQVVGQRLTGIPPGDTVEGPVVEGAVLPGVIRARSMGNPPRIPPPAGLSEAQKNDLLELSRTEFVDLAVIGPAIPIGAREPELGFDVVLRNVSNHYLRELSKVSHPDTATMRAIFARIAKDGATFDDPAVQAGLEEIRALRPDRLVDPWHRQLSEALAICAQALLSGAVPVRAAIP